MITLFGPVIGSIIYVALALILGLGVWALIAPVTRCPSCGAPEYQCLNMRALCPPLGVRNAP